MIKIAVFSDTHGYHHAILKCVEIAKDADVFFHLGDHIEDFHHIKKLSKKEGYGVIGNTDFGSEGEETQIIQIKNKIILLTHGHLFNVKRTIEKLTYYCEQEKVDIALFGHSHMTHISKINGILYVNPGSAAVPRGLDKPSYAIITIDGYNIDTQINHLS